jgi:predicted alpha/beta-fold hydrolase
MPLRVQPAMNYAAPWWLPGGNLQTIWAALRSRRFLGPQPLFRRERWTTPDEDFVDVDWLVDDASTCGGQLHNSRPSQAAAPGRISRP